jgi:hypothetical protein
MIGAVRRLWTGSSPEHRAAALLFLVAAGAALAGTRQSLLACAMAFKPPAASQSELVDNLMGALISRGQCRLFTGIVLPAGAGRYLPQLCP